MHSPHSAKEPLDLYLEQCAQPDLPKKTEGISTSQLILYMSTLKWWFNINYIIKYIAYICLLWITSGFIYQYEFIMNPLILSASAAWTSTPHLQSCVLSRWEWRWSLLLGCLCPCHSLEKQLVLGLLCLLCLLWLYPYLQIQTEERGVWWSLQISGGKTWNALQCHGCHEG